LVTEIQNESFKTALDHENGGSILLRNVCQHIYRQMDTASCPGILLALISFTFLKFEFERIIQNLSHKTRNLRHKLLAALRVHSLKKSPIWRTLFISKCVVW
jgi:hypothetical protein